DAAGSRLGVLGAAGTEAGDVHALAGDALAFEVLLDGHGAFGAEAVVGLPLGLADGIAVGVAFDADGVTGVLGLEHLGDAIEGLLGAGLEGDLAGVEEDVALDDGGDFADAHFAGHAGDALEAGGRLG